MNPSADPTTAPEPGGLHLSRVVADQFAYHVRMSAVFALSGEAVESASESVLAWALLDANWSEAGASTDATAAELIDQESAQVSVSARDAATARARALALDIQAHYVSVGRQAEASLYADVAERLNGAVDALLAHR